MIRPDFPFVKATPGSTGLRSAETPHFSTPWAGITTSPWSDDNRMSLMTHRPGASGAVDGGDHTLRQPSVGPISEVIEEYADDYSH